jgi:hypothetical protein
MAGFVHPDEAANSLAEVRRLQRQVIDAVMVPMWYWWAVAAAMIAIGLAVDARRPVMLAIVIPLAAAVLAAMTGAMIFGAYRRARVRSPELLGARGAMAIVGFVWLIVGLTLGTGFALRAAGSSAPATIATVVGGAAIVVGGPLLGRWLRRTMLANHAGPAGPAGAGG